MDDSTSDETFSSLESDKTDKEQDNGKDLAKNDFILVKLLSVKSNERFYIAQILKIKENDEYNVKFLRVSEQVRINHVRLLSSFITVLNLTIFSFLQVMGQYFFLTIYDFSIGGDRS